MTAGGATSYLHYDQVGSLRLVTDSSGAVVKQLKYDTFGNLLSDSNPALTVPFGFAGGLHDRDTGLVRFGFRDYLPELGKWTAKDPIGFAGGDSNLFGYVENDPVNWVDPEGLWTVSVGVNIGGALGAIGGGGGTAVNIGYSESKGFSASLTGTVGGGAITGIGAGVGITFTGTDACSVDQLLGTSVEASRGLGPLAISGIAGNGYKGAAFTAGLSGKSVVPSQGAGTLTSTSAIVQWESGSGTSFFKTGK
jgi:RHS repeat-associated protein